MAIPTTVRPHQATPSQRRDTRRVAVATVVGTTIEWYDFFLYANAAGLVFAQLYFEPAGPQLAILLSFGSVGVSFLFRPLGAFLAGHFGDILGRKAMLVITLILMGASTVLIGVLPTYAQIGVMAPVLLLLLRILQGISAGGEWGGAVLMAVEHAPDAKRGRFGAFPQLGVPLGLLLATGMLAIMTAVAPGEAFIEWGWRVPFLLSIVLIVVGFVVRRSVEESPVFLEIRDRAQRTKKPVVVLFRKHWRLVLLAALTFAGMNSAGYMTTGGYIQNYATNPDGPVGLDRQSVLVAVSISAVTWLIFTMLAGIVSDRIGRRATYIVGWIALIAAIFPLFALVNTGNIWLLCLGLCLFTVGLGFTYGQQAAFYAELFPASIRFSGVSISYALGSILGGAFAPMIATALVQATGTSVSVGVYLTIMATIAFAATLAIRDRTGIPLGPDHEEEQSAPAIYGMSRT
ncbi:MFS transporter [Klugiella xanthotipulae]|uniref:Putative MFS family arabinose efflux permease n=1 Tax=Klugiella xanthotipulae TaxID=244735 RepID=A0A543HXW5_9MICO|nr:MFS transporter [Klugiella xanthotipulae]TQM63110.1 putative MFS family arabinose efflux permease [Klugiella xanthotipulae]